MPRRMLQPVSSMVIFGLAAFAAGCASPSHPRPPRPLLLTTDAGCEVDDQWALVYLLLAAEEGEIDLRGIVTTHAPNLKPPAAASSAAVAREVMAVLGPRQPPPVIPGSSQPLEAQDRPRRGLGAEFIVEMSKAFSPTRRLTVLAIGAATDVASALLIDPGAAERLEVVAIGFECWTCGGDPWNVKNDPLAFRVILASPVPLWIGSSEVCNPLLALDADQARRITRGGGAAGAYLATKLEGWLEREDKLCRRTTGRRAWPIWDTLTVAHLLGLARDEVRPRPRLRDDLTFDLQHPQGELHWITSADADALWRDFAARLQRREEARAAAL